jgi:hypothetical protein
LTGAQQDPQRLAATVRTDDPDAARCPASREVSTSGKDLVLTRPKDLPCGGGVVLLQSPRASPAPSPVGARNSADDRDLRVRHRLRLGMIAWWRSD